ncbi:MAG TPA: hydroxyphenylacetyl-CoA thioesterase PaaI [Peptococcaceae bacterium]|nr:MAG: Thioesterase superfamily protein [Clostridia bacterium 41_269]HBT20239.1 hydroxyphenylacetyl-CoA thioesterase PaaI [Peptococcaceae bacterium]
MENKIIAELKEKFLEDRYPQFLGIKLLKLEDGRAEVEMVVEKEHLNLFGITHGGVIFSLADTALGLASNSSGQNSVALNCSINFIKATKSGEVLRAEAVEVKRTRKTGVYTVNVFDSQNNLVALATGTCYILSNQK